MKSPSRTIREKVFCSQCGNVLGYNDGAGLTVALCVRGNPLSKSSLENLCRRADGDIVKVRYPCPSCGEKKVLDVKCPPEAAS